jgi:hypothetical protein
MKCRKDSRCGWSLPVTVMSIILVTGTHMVAHTSRSRSSNPQYLSSQDPVEVSLILSTNGFDPSDITIGSGRFLLSLDNRSGVQDLVLRLSKADGTVLRDLRVPGVGGDWSEMFDLPAGSYTLSVADHSTWVCQLVVRSSAD